MPFIGLPVGIIGFEYFVCDWNSFRRCCSLFATRSDPACLHLAGCKRVVGLVSQFLSATNRAVAQTKRLPARVRGLKLTEESRRRHGAVAARNHDADAGLHERNGELDDLRPLLVDGEGPDGHVRSVGHHLERRPHVVGRIHSFSMVGEHNIWTRKGPRNVWRQKPGGSFDFEAL